MALKTTLAQLEEVQTAITNILEGGQSGSLGDKAVELAKLSALSTREDSLLKRYKQETGAGTQKINQGIIKRD